MTTIFPKLIKTINLDSRCLTNSIKKMWRKLHQYTVLYCTA